MSVKLNKSLILGIIGRALIFVGFVLCLGLAVPVSPLAQVNDSVISRPPARDNTGRFPTAVVGSLEVIWKDVFARDAKSYRPPLLVLYKEVTTAACGGMARQEYGPFYCPIDQNIYLSTSFFQQIENIHRCEIAADPCAAFAAYVIAHEVAHHVQNQLGILPTTQQAMREANNPEQVRDIRLRLELQADCLVGVWAKMQNQRLAAEGKPPSVELGELENALRMPDALGHDRLSDPPGAIVADGFRHGNAEQRERWLKYGYDSGLLETCNTFAAKEL